MSDWKKWTVGGVIAAIFGLAVGVPLSRHNTAPGPLEQQVDRFQELEKGQDAATRYKDVQAKIEELERLINDAHFSELAPARQEELRARLKELRAYQEYDKKLAAISGPYEAESEEQLQSSRAALEKLAAPSEYEGDWKRTEAAERREQWLSDATILARAVLDTRRDYHELIQDGKDVLKNKDSPNLPGRAQAVLDRARTLPNPDRDHDRIVPDTAKVTYAMVFRFPAVAGTYAEWVKLQKNLEPIAALQSPSR